MLTEDEGADMFTRFLGPLGRHEAAARKIVGLLEGLPLALELAARRCDEGAEDLPWLLGQLQSKPMLGVLTLPGRASRETSVEYTLSLSLQGLDADFVRRFRALGVFAPAPFDLPALAAVWQDEDLDLAKEAARQLVRRALLQRGEERLPAGAAPEHLVYVQHALLRAYALALALAAGEAEEAAGRHAAHFAALPDQSWQQGELFWPQVEHAWARADGRTLDERLDFLVAVKNFAYRRGLWEPVRRRAEVLLAELQASGERPGGQAFLFVELGYNASALGDKAQALQYYEQALPIQRQVGDKGGEATTLNNIGGVYSDLGDKAQALAFYEQALPMYRQVGDKAGEAATLNNIGAVYDALGDKAQALAFYEQALPLSRQVGDKAGEATTLNNIGKVHSALGDKAQALQYYEQALPLSRQVGDKAGEAKTLNNIGGVHSDLGDQAQALAFYEQALPLQRQVGDKAGEATTLNNIGAVHDALGDQAQALAFYEQALPLQRQVGDKAGEAATLNNIGAVHDALGDKAQALAFYEQALPLQRQVGDKAGEAATLNNIGAVYAALGDKAQALAFFEQALPLSRQVGDRWGESITCYNMGMIYANLGDLARAERLLMRTVELDEAIGHPNLKNDRAALEQVRTRRAAAQVRQARDGDQELAEHLSPLLEQLAKQEDAPPEIQNLAHVLLQLLAGQTSLDLSGLPPRARRGRSRGIRPARTVADIRQITRLGERNEILARLMV